MTTSELAPSPLNHELQRHFKDLAEFQSTEECMESTLFGALRPELDRVLGGLEEGSFSPAKPFETGRAIRVAAWNIERGIQLDGVLEVLANERTLGASELLLLTEVDYGMARTSNRHVAKEIAARLGLSFKTVGTHRSHIMEKLSIHSVAGLTKYAIREGLTTAEE